MRKVTKNNMFEGNLQEQLNNAVREARKFHQKQREKKELIDEKIKFEACNGCGEDHEPEDCMVGFNTADEDYMNYNDNLSREFNLI